MEETRNCQNCKQNFIIAPEDFEFYKKIDVPAPTFCPSCRLQRRLAWMVGIRLWKRSCDLCGKMEISMYRHDAPYKVYCHRCWWSDRWEAKEYGRDYDFSKPFFQQWKELFNAVPVLGLSIDAETGKYSPFTNHCGHAKGCYMIFYSDYNEDVLYGFMLSRNKNILDCSNTGESERSYDCNQVLKVFNTVGSKNTLNTLDSCFLYDCEHCTKCFGSINLRHKSYVFFNEQMSKEDYEKKIKEIDLGSYKNYCEWKQKAKEHWKKYPPRPVYDLFSEHSSGSNYFQCKNCKECYGVTGGQDSKYLMLIKTAPVNDSYDFTDWGENVTRAYECMTVGVQCSNVKFLHESGFNIANIEYSKLQIGGSNCFGCVSLKKGEYCILNKQYTKEEYEDLLPKIKKHMVDQPYIDKKGKIYRYGEYFPIEFSPHGYNHTFANLFFPKTKEEIQEKQFSWGNEDRTEYVTTLSWQKLPDHIKNVEDSILKEVIECKSCVRGFKIVQQELLFLRDSNLPLPRECPFCRIEEKTKEWISNMHVEERECDKCGNVLTTQYSKERAPVIWCKDCYKKEYY